MTVESSRVSMRELVKKFIAESIGKDIESKCRTIFPIRDVHIRKVKVLRKPKFDSAKFMELHQESENTGEEAMVDAAGAGG
eukprot:CAMPEP_0113866262 /NCGR_PEP_ID=MMETSP0372-20130328/18946_1 /TAXON_ID=340204 /ORGANISM="Lankesteria abbotti" /LENGTH=80 /DNA_ID=CAMNT_0000850859 /DNA_START=383 /DNA_END=621 /DNA_ORIENTATION=- /assembly_acc=CAM_ASM_000359